MRSKKKFYSTHDVPMLLIVFNATNVFIFIIFQPAPFFRLKILVWQELHLLVEFRESPLQEPFEQDRHMSGRAYSLGSDPLPRLQACVSFQNISGSEIPVEFL